MMDNTLQQWRKHLTPERRKHFERIGEDLVRTDVSRRAYSTDEKRFAALAWLHECQNKREQKQTRRFWAMFLVALAAMLAGLCSVAVTKGWL